MAFRFTLESLLRLRISQEHQQELLLQAANHQVAHIGHYLANLESREKSLSLGEQALLADGMPAAEMHFVDQCLSVLEEHKRAVHKELVKAQQALAQQIAAFEEARRQRRLVEELRERRRQVYRQLESRREQRSLDDLYLILRGRRPTG